MIDKVSDRELHDRATRGGTLTETELTTLEAWYEQQDAEEEAQFATSALAVSPDLATLQAEVAQALAQLNKVTRQIQAQSDENEALRQEISALSSRLTQGLPSKAA